MIHIFGGGTVTYVRNHLAICAPAYGRTARQLADLLEAAGTTSYRLHLTKMANGMSAMETNEDVAARLSEVLSDPATRAVVFNVALCDFNGQIGEVPSGKYAERLQSRDGETTMTLTPAAKLLGSVKAIRPDVRVVGFKTTAGAELIEQASKAARQIQETGADWVVANDTVTRTNLLVTRHSCDSGCAEELPRGELLAKLAHDLVMVLREGK